jgi:Zn-dependent protease
MTPKGMLIGRIAGVEIRASRSWIVILMLAMVVMASQLAREVPSLDALQLLGLSAVATLLFFGSIILHELAHCVVARRFGIQAKSIMLNFFGGLSWLTRRPLRPIEEFAYTIVGPLVNLVLAAVLLVVSFLLEGQAPALSVVAAHLGSINLVLGLFNLVPGFPLDGGRILRSVVWWMTGSYEKGTFVASLAGQGIGALLLMVGLAVVFAKGLEGLWICLVGYYLLTRARTGMGEVALRRALAGLTVGNLWLDTLPQIERTASLTEFLKRMAPEQTKLADPHFMVVEEGVIWGMLPASRVMQVDSRQWDTASVGDVMTPIDKVQKLSYQTDIMQAIEAVYASDVAELPVVEENEVQGFVGRDALLRFVASRMAAQNG